MVVRDDKYRVLYVTDQVLEERSYNHIDDLANPKVDLALKLSLHVELSKLSTACDVLNSTSLIKFVQGRVSKLSSVDRVLEVEGNIVHEETKVI